MWKFFTQTGAEKKSAVSVNYGTSLPANPVDGQEAILTDSLEAPTYAWRFRYVSEITDAYKWVFIGGAPMMISSSSGSGLTTSYVTMPGITLTVPRIGIYEFSWAGKFWQGTGSGNSYAKPIAGSAVFTPLLADDDDGIGAYLNAIWGKVGGAMARKLIVTTAGTINFQAKSEDITGGPTFRGGYMQAIPVRVA